MDNIIINIDSQFRNRIKYPNSSFFVYTLAERIKNCKYIRLSSIEIPNLFFSFTKAKKNVSFKITIKGIETTVLIEEGMYNSDQLLNAIQDKFDVINTAQATNLTVSLDYVTGFVTFKAGADQFIVNFENSDQRLLSLGYYIGFRKTNYTSNLVSGVHTLTTESQLNCNGYQYIFLRVNDYGVIVHDFEEASNALEPLDRTKKYQSNKNILAKVVLSNPKGYQVFDNSANFLTKAYVFRQPTDLSKLELELIDPFGDRVEMLKMEYSITLEIGIIINSDLKDNMTNDVFQNYSITGNLFKPEFKYNKY